MSFFPVEYLQKLEGCIATRYRHRCLDVSQGSGSTVNRSAAGSQYSVTEPAGRPPDRQISLSATITPRRCYLLSFSWLYFKWNKNDIFPFLFLAFILLDTQKTNSLTVVEEYRTPFCERNKIYSCFSDSSSSERTMDLVLEMCNTNSIHWCGISGRQLGKLNPSSSLCLALTLLSSVQGLQVCSLFNNFNRWGPLTHSHILYPYFLW